MQMLRRKLVLEKVARKNMADAAKLRMAISEQTKQIQGIAELMERVNELKENAKDSNCTKPTDLAAARWYSLKLSEQLIMLQNRIEFAEKELEDLRKMSRENSLKNNKLDDLIKKAKTMVLVETERGLEKQQQFHIFQSSA